MHPDAVDAASGEFGKQAIRIRIGFGFEQRVAVEGEIRVTNTRITGDGFCFDIVVERLAESFNKAEQGVICNQDIGSEVINDYISYYRCALFVAVGRRGIT